MKIATSRGKALLTKGKGARRRKLEKAGANAFSIAEKIQDDDAAAPLLFGCGLA